MNAVDFMKYDLLQLYEQAGIPLSSEANCQYASSEISAAFLNRVVPQSDKPVDFETTVKKIAEFFQDKTLPHSWWFVKPLSDGKELLKKYGLTSKYPFHAMVIDREVTSSESPLSVHEVKTQKDLDAWKSVLGKVYGVDDILDSYAALFSTYRNFIGKIDDMTVSTGTLLETSNGAYIYNISTLETQRNRGYATHMTCTLTHIAQRKELFRTGLICPSRAKSMYNKLGFVEVTTFEVYT